jgi:dihydroneopterin aldolase
MNKINHYNPGIYDRIFITDIEIDMCIGIHEHEKQISQKVKISADLFIEPRMSKSDDIKTTVSYSEIVENIKNVTSLKQYSLLETLAEEIAEECLQNKKINMIIIRVEKPEVYSFAASVGTEIIRYRNQ